ncbi:PepSY domain-containing protein [Pseudomonadota bacterium]|nr:PepSY domain-containing protein [Pseudomonadota bacterium]MDC0198865.1 PepSY domain-containing protein [Pseudomonadota bacterium]
MAKITLRKFHKYISLLIAIQLLLWTISGIYFSFNKIENVRGEQYLIAEVTASIVDKPKIEKLDFESAMQIIKERTILQPQTIEIINDPQRGSEYRGRDLPLYKAISLSNEGKEINVYQDPFSGEIVAIRSAQWRIWDLMWGLHIMDWVDRDDIDNLLLKIFSFIALFTSISGVILFFKKS